jgi:polyribonucleotide nucleotidyltransferase
MAVTVAGTEEKVVMIEAGADEVPEEIVYEGILKGHEAIREICRFIKKIKEEIGKPTIEYESAAPDPEMLSAVRDFARGN